MAKKTQDEMIQWVVAKIDEATPGETLTAENMPVGFIEDELENSARHIIEIGDGDVLAKLNKLATEHAPGSGIAPRLVINEDKSAYLVLPSDFKRFQGVKLSGWDRPVYTLLDRKSPTYQAQFNSFRRGSYVRPVAVLAPFTSYTVNEQGAWENSGLKLDLFSAKESDDTLEFLEYIPQTTAANMPEELQDAVACVCAARVLQILQRQGDADRFMALAYQQINYEVSKPEGI